MAVLEDFEVLDDETLDDESMYDESGDDESGDDESEFLGSLLGGPASLIGNALGGLFGGNRGGSSRPPLPHVSVGIPGAGVSTATINTPAGNATLRLPEPVVTRREFEAGIRKLQEGINRDATRVNAVSKDLDILRTRVATVVTETQRDLVKVRTMVIKNRRANRLAIARLRREQSSQQMMSMLMAIMSTQQVQNQHEDHTHAGAGGAVVGTGDNDNDNSMMMMLPMMMMSQGGGADNNAMMMPMMMLAMSK